MKELRIFGPPGTGKSTRLATEEIPNAVRKFGTDKVVVTSFTKAGAQTIATKQSFLTGRPIPVERQNVGTLHALCYRQLGNPEIAEKHIKEWNATHPQYEMIEKDFGSLDEGGMGHGDLNGIENKQDGHQLLNALNILRAKMIDQRYWPHTVLKFAHTWGEFKKEANCMDFTDLIETAIRNLPYAPGRPNVIFVDEAQDFTRLQLELVRSWGHQAKWIVLVGDDDQTIYSFAGATPDAFLNPPIDNKFKRVLDQSYRVPRAVFERAMKIVNKISVREPKEYKPRNAEGTIRISDEKFTNPQVAINEAKEYIADGKTVMFLASCAYMLEPLKRTLKEQGLPFCNPYRLTRGDWNPLQTGSTKVTARDLLVNFLSCGTDGDYWDIRQLVSWAQYLKVKEGGLIRKQGKAGIKALKQAIADAEQGIHTARNVLSQLLTAEAVMPALNRDIDWLYANLLAARQPALDYPIHVYKQFGEKAVKDKPKIIIGTIHSVKGGEADIVYLFPDISYQARKELNAGANIIQKRDEIYRLFYVAMTRAKEELVIMSPSIQKGGGYHFVEL